MGATGTSLDLLITTWSLSTVSYPTLANLAQRTYILLPGRPGFPLRASVHFPTLGETQNDDEPRRKPIRVYRPAESVF